MPESDLVRIEAEARTGAWAVERGFGPAASLHALGDPARPARVARVLEVDRPSLVLGSSQPLGLVDSERAAAAGVAVARRRSGGGAVYLDPGRHVWVDLLVPRGDRLWDDDVVRAAIWAGELWGAVAASLVGEPASVHRGGSAGGRWGRLICFAGLGPAEVTVGGRKVVGISQRRSRDWTRIQTMARIAPGEGAPTPAPVVGAGPGPCPDRGAGSGAGAVLDEAGLLVLTEDERSRGRAVVAARSGALAAGPGPVVEALLSLLPS